MVSASVKMRVSFIEVGIRHRMASLPMLYSMIFTDILKLKLFKRYYLGN